MTVLGAVLAALAPYGGLVLGVVIGGPAPAGQTLVGTAVAMTGIAAGYVALLVTTRRWPFVFKIVAAIAYTVFLAWSLFYVALIAACAVFKNCL